MLRPARLLQLSLRPGLAHLPGTQERLEDSEGTKRLGNLELFQTCTLPALRKEMNMYYRVPANQEGFHTRLHFPTSAPRCLIPMTRPSRRMDCDCKDECHQLQRLLDQKEKRHVHLGR
jgi:hypothetical protein